MNIQTASDFEINKAVAESLGHKVRAYGGMVFLCDIDIGPTGVDYCNQWQDAGPIIQGNEIGIRPPDILSPSWMAMNSANGKNNSYIFCSNNNPMRAAMEVYLMIKARES